MNHGIGYYLQTFGCKSNQYESQAIREALNARGHSETRDPARAQVLIVNTCGVTGRAGASCRNAIRKTLRANPSLRVIITGCGVDLGEKWPAPASGQPTLVPNAKKHALPDMMESMAFTVTELAAIPDDRFALSISAFHGHTRAFIKIQDGCDNFCSYCAVPYARGKPESRPRRDVLEEARRLVGSGHRELVLTGINIGAYDDHGLGLPGLAAVLAETPGLVRLRLGSVEPPQMTEELVRVMAAQPAICPHVHLPLQSGDDGVLKRMGRRYGAGEFLDKVAMLRESLRLPAITTDIIVGFPGEDEAAAFAGEELCRRAGFSRLHVFLFSPRPGTSAAAMRRTATDREIEARKTRLIALGEKLSLDYASSCVGLEERAIMERSGGGLTDRYVKVRLEDGDAHPGNVEYILVDGVDGGELISRRRPEGRNPPCASAQPQ